MTTMMPDPTLTRLLRELALAGALRLLDWQHDGSPVADCRVGELRGPAFDGSWWIDEYRIPEWLLTAQEDLT